MIRTFSQKFPSYHIRKGQPTFFVEKILNGLGVAYGNEDYLEKLLKLNHKKIESGKLTFEDIESFWLHLCVTDQGNPIDGEKHHTIRSGNHLKVGDKITPAVWFGRPYHDPQLIFWDDLEVVYCPHFINHEDGLWTVNSSILSYEQRFAIADNDGLEYNDMQDWFNKPMTGQVICWREGIKY